MKVTKIRKNNKLLTEKQFNSLISKLQKRIKKAGFVVDIDRISSSGINIHGNRCSFTIDPNILGYNLRFSPGRKPRKSRTPTWDQRVDFNNLINNVFNEFSLSANIKSGDFIIREEFHCYNETDWQLQKPELISINEQNGFYVSK